MTPSTTSTPYGAPAYRALVAVVRSAKDGDPLRPVTVVVPSELVGVAARRALARGDGSPGIAALSIVTWRRLAESLGANELTAGGRRPLTTTMLAGRIRGLLGEDPGAFEPVAEHIGTVRALARAHRALRTVSDAHLDALSVGERVVAETVKMHRELSARCAPTAFDEVDLLMVATRLVGRVGDAVVVFLPHDLDAPERALLAALGEATTVEVVRGVTGDPDVDGGITGETAPLASRIVHASDPDDEVRGVVREVVAALAGGTPGHRIAVFYGAADPYARLLHEHLASAGVTFFGRGVNSVLDGRFGRGLLRLLRLPDHDFRRDEVLAWITDAPVRHQGRRIHSSPWERVSRAAGVVSDVHWVRLAEHAARLREHAEAERRSPEPREWLIDRDEREATTAEELLSFVDGLRARFENLATASTWTELGEGICELWADVLGGAGSTRWPEESRAVTRIEAALRAIAQLGADAGRADLRRLRELVELQLADDVDRVGVTGIGVHIGPLSDAVGAQCDRVFVLGAAEGTLPSRQSDDPLLPDRVRARTGGELPTLAEQIRRRHHQFLAALAAAPPGGRVVTFPRGDLRSGGVRVPSRWLLPSLRALSGDDRLTITTWEHARAPGITDCPSYAGELARTGQPATEQEWRQRVAAQARAEGLPLPSEAGGEVHERGAATRTARREANFGPHTGNLAGERLPDPTEGAPVSATALQTWVGCPDDYFMRYLLKVAPVTQPEEVVRISALDRGTVLHDILEELVKRAMDEEWAPDFDEPWPARADAELDVLADQRFARAEAEGVTGFARLWAQDREALRADLHAWLRHDDDRRRKHGGLAPVAGEWAFGYRDSPAAELELGDGRLLRLRGKIDRIDRDRAGRLVVTDYKSGGSDGYKTLSAEAPCAQGRLLQLPIYAMAARAGLAADGSDEPIRSSFWFTSRKGGFAEIGYPVDRDVMDRATEVVRAIVDGMTLGVFPARPSGRDPVRPGQRPSSNRCHACDPDGLGEGAVTARWERLADQLDRPRLQRVHALLFGEVGG